MKFENSFIENLFKIICEENKEIPIESQSKKLMEAFLDYGSNTEDNLNCYAHIEYGYSFNNNGAINTLGLKLKGTDLLLSDVIHALEDLDIPKEIKEEFPDISKKKWEAALRMTAIILLAIERRVG